MKQAIDSRLMYARSVCVTVIKYGDTTTIRLLLANASFLYAALLCIYPDSFSRHGYELMAQAADEAIWAALFIVHGIGVYWRIFDPVPRPKWALTVNTLGFLVWGVSTLAFNVALGRVTPTSAMEWTLCLASAWSLLRTGFTKESVTP